MLVWNPGDRMAGDQRYSRVDLVKAKNLITEKLGGEQAEKYFNLLSRFFTRKINRSDFNKLCIVAVGHENIALHNCFIRSIVKNASLSKSAPAKPRKLVFSVNGKVVNGYQRSCYHSLYKDLYPNSPRKRRTPTFRRYRDQPSPLGPHGKPRTPACQESGLKVLEQQNATELNSLGSKPIETITVEDDEEVQNAGSPGICSRKTLTAPIGVQFRGNGSHSISSVPIETCYGKGELPDTFSLKTRLERAFVAEGLNFSLEYANLLNTSLDMYLTNLIEPCLELARSRAREMQILNGAYVQRSNSYTVSSPVDLHTAMELDTTLQQNWQAGTGNSRFRWDSNSL